MGRLRAPLSVASVSTDDLLKVLKLWSTEVLDIVEASDSASENLMECEVWTFFLEPDLEAISLAPDVKTTSLTPSR